MTEEVVAVDGVFFCLEQWKKVKWLKSWHQDVSLGSQSASQSASCPNMVTSGFKITKIMTSVIPNSRLQNGGQKINRWCHSLLIIKSMVFPYMCFNLVFVAPNSTKDVWAMFRLLCDRRIAAIPDNTVDPAITTLMREKHAPCLFLTPQSRSSQWGSLIQDWH